jgi:hypothetical protein
VHIVTANHDEHGWSGMEITGQSLIKMARLSGMQIRYTTEGEEDK